MTAPRRTPQPGKSFAEGNRVIRRTPLSYTRPVSKLRRGTVTEVRKHDYKVVWDDGGVDFYSWYELAHERRPPGAGSRHSGIPDDAPPRKRKPYDIKKARRRT